MSYTHLDPGIELEISERVYFSDRVSDLSTLVTLPPEKLKQMEQASVEQEKAIYSSLRDMAVTWGRQARETLDLRKAQEYLKLPPTEHTGNQWVDGEYDWHTLSNMVYKFTYRIYEQTKWDRTLEKSVPVAWELSWYVVYNTPNNPDYSGPGRQIAGQQQKVFKDPASMQKYLQGRIKAYAHLFTEISPPIPEGERRRFCVNGVLLPGYTVETPDTLKPDEAAVDKLLAFLGNDELGGAAPAPTPQEKAQASPTRVPFKAARPAAKKKSHSKNRDTGR